MTGLGYNMPIQDIREANLMKPNNPAERHVVVLGASNKPLRYSNKAIRLLLEKGYRVTPVHPKQEVIEGFSVAPNLRAVSEPVDTLTLYLGPQRLAPMIDEVIALGPGRIIFNPGTESPELMRKVEQAGIQWLEACTLVLLRIGTF
jgi:predicted CoA-binding protein